MPTNEGWTEDGYPKTIKWADHLYVLERTCRIVERYEAKIRAEIGRERVKLSCGHMVERHSKFCCKCGAKVVE